MDVHQYTEYPTIEYQASFLILCSITIVGLILLPSVLGLAKAEKDISSGNVTGIFEKGLDLYKLGNYTQAVQYFDKALAINPKDENALTYKAIALDYLDIFHRDRHGKILLCYSPSTLDRRTPKQFIPELLKFANQLWSPVSSI